MNAFVHEPRQRLGDRDRAKLFLERGGCCHRCTRKLGPKDDWIVEHLVALENGGTNAWDNLTVTCSWCKPAKDGEDHKAAAHSKRVSVKHVVPKKRREKRGGFRGWRKFDRTIVWRD